MESHGDSLRVWEENLTPGKSRILLSLAALLVAPSLAAAQMTGGMNPGMGMGSGMGMGQGTGMGAGTSEGNGSGGGFTNPEDLITATAPPFTVSDVIRMHRVGLSDIVIVNELRTRYHPIMLTAAQTAKLKAAGVDKRVRYAMEDPFGIGLAKVRAYLAKEDKLLQQSAPESPSRSVGVTKPGHISEVTSPAVKTPTSITARRHAASPAQSPTLHAGQAARLQPTLQPRPVHQASHGSMSAALNLAHAPYTAVPPVPVTMLVRRPSGQGIYLRHGSDWQRVDQESIYWQKRGHGYTGSVLRPGSDTATYPGGSDFLILTPSFRSAIEYQLVRLKPDGLTRVFAPDPPGEVYSAGIGADLVPFSPAKIGPSTWIVRLNDLPPGQYGFLPPVPLLMHSATGLATTIYTFEVQ